MQLGRPSLRFARALWRRGPLLACLTPALLTGCVDVLGDFHPTGGAVGSGGSSASTGVGGRSAGGSGGSDAPCHCDEPGCADPVCVTPSIWVRSFGDTQDQLLRTVALDRRNNVILAGTITGSVSFGLASLTSAGDTDTFVAELDAKGNPIFSVLIGGSLHDDAGGAAADPDGNVLVAGTYSGDIALGPEHATPDPNIFVAKLAPDGAMLWAHSYGDLAEQQAHAVASGGAGEVLVTGCIAGSADFGDSLRTSQGPHDTFVLKLDGGGSTLWSHTLGGTGDSCGDRIAVDRSGNVLVAGTYMGSPSANMKLPYYGKKDVFILKLDPSGNIVWLRSINGAGDEAVGGLQVDASDNVMMAGMFDETVSWAGNPMSAVGAHDPFAVMLDPDGTPKWSATAPALDDQVIFGAALDASGDVFLCGASGVSSTIPETLNAYAVKLRPDGTSPWTQLLNSADEQSERGIAIDSTGTLVVGGQFAGQIPLGGTLFASKGEHDIFIEKLAPP